MVSDSLVNHPPPPATSAAGDAIRNECCRSGPGMVHQTRF